MYGRENQSWQRAVPVAGGTMTGPLVLWADPNTALGAATKQMADGKVAKIGDTMTGALVLPGNPTQALQSAPKQYVDTRVMRTGDTMTGPLILNADPTVALGAATKQTVDAKVSKAGDTMIGPLVLPGDPTSPLQASTKAYVDAHTPGAITEAPSDSYLYGRVNATWARSLPLAGGNMTGAIVLPSDPTQPLQAATKQMVDVKIARTGDTMTGPLVLPGDPTQPLQAASKAYVDSHAPGALPEAPVDSYLYGRANAAWARSLPLAGGTMTGPLSLAADPTTPFGAATKQIVDAKIARAGDAMTGELTLAADPVAALDAATKQYVDARVARTGDTMTGTLTLAADPVAALDASTKQYVDAHVGGITEAPLDSFFYGRVNATWAKGLALTGGTLTGPLVLVADPTSPLQAATKQYSDLRVLKAGDTMTGDLILQGTPASGLGAAPKQYVDARVLKSGDTMTGPLVLPGDPTSALQAADKNYVDTHVAPACGMLRVATASPSASLGFYPFKGNLIKINGSIYPIPAAGIISGATGVYVGGVAGQSLAVSTFYYVYLFNNAGTLTFDFSTTSHATSTTAGNVGVEIKAGDDTRSLIGIIYTGPSLTTAFYDDIATRYTRTWFNRTPVSLQGPGSSWGPSNAAAWTATGLSFTFIQFKGETILAMCTGLTTVNAAAAYCLLCLANDGNTFGPVAGGSTYGASGGYVGLTVVANTSTLSEGALHMISLMVQAGAGASISGQYFAIIGNLS
jgi:hypothetical protein